MIATLGREVMVRSALWPGYEAPYSQLWCCLLRQTPVDGESGQDLLEPSTAFGYSRQYVALGQDFWLPRDTNTLVYASPVLFPQPTGPWGRINAWALTTEAGGGDVFAFGNADVGDVTATSTPPEIDEGGLVVRLARTTL
jgi:hypothetical protein